MKSHSWILLAVLTAFGCGHKGVGTSELQSSFQSSEPAMQTLVDKAVSAIKSNNYPEALNNLQLLEKKAKETPDQQQAVKDTIEAVQKHISEMAAQKPATPQPTNSSNSDFLKKILGH